MNKKIIVVTFVLITMFTTMFNMTSYAVYANTNTDYKQIYLNYAKDADKNYSNKLNDAISGLILVDLNDDEVPEMLAFSTSVSHFDKDGNQVYVVNEGYDRVAYNEYSHTIVKAFSIINGEIIEDSPWKRTMYSYVINMPFLPDEDIEDTEEFCGVFEDKNSEKYFCTYGVNSGTISLWYDENGFGYSRGDLDNDFFDNYSPADLPVASIEFYDDEKQQKLTRSEAMEMLLSKYDNFSNTSLHTNVGNPKNKVSDWAVSEVNEAKKISLIPQEMLNDDLTENITRAEFAAIAYKLYEVIVGGGLNWHGGYIVDIDDNIYEMYIRGAYNYGITKGTGEEDGGVIFSPDLNITREQLATMLLRVIKLSKFETWDVENDSSFPLDISNTKKFDDDGKISDYANESVYYMSKHGIIKGVDNTHFAPLDTATKEQAILLALRIYNAFETLPIVEEKQEDKIVAVEDIKISKEKLTLYVGDTETLTATIIPKNAANQTIEWISSNEDIITVSSDGILKAKKTGTAAVDAQIREDNKIYVSQCIITVLSEDNDDYDFENGTIKKYKGNSQNVIVPKEINGQKVLCIGKSAFYDNDNLKTIELPNGITGIEEKAFAMCNNFENIIIPDSVIYVRDEAFWGCNKLKNAIFSKSMTIIQKEVLASCSNLISVAIPDTIEEIFSNAFYDCTSLESITIPSSVKEIDYTAFTNCSNIKRVYFQGTEQEWNSITVKSDINEYTASDLFPNAIIYCKKDESNINNTDDKTTTDARSQRPTVEIDNSEDENIGTSSPERPIFETDSNNGGNSAGTTKPTRPTAEVDTTVEETKTEAGSTRPTRPVVDNN